MKNSLITKQDDWQLHGALTRETIVTNESLYNIIFFNDDNLNNTSTTLLNKANLRISSANNEGARLEHDIITINSDLIAVNELSYMTDKYPNRLGYLSNAIGIANPVYDSRAAYKCVSLFKDPSTSKCTIAGLAKILAPYDYLKTKEATTVHQTIAANYMTVIKNKFSSMVVADETDDTISSIDSFTDTKPISVLYNSLSEEGKILFNDLFSLHFHDSSAAKLPYKQLSTTGDSPTYERKLYTRYLLNLVPSIASQNSTISYNWTEKMSLEDEDALDDAVANNKKDRVTGNDELESELGVIQTRISNISNAGILTDASIAVYVNSEIKTTMPAIYIVDSEDTAIGNILKNNTGETYKFYKRVKISNAMVDEILYMRNPWYRYFVNGMSTSINGLAWSQLTSNKSSWTGADNSRDTTFDYSLADNDIPFLHLMIEVLSYGYGVDSDGKNDTTVYDLIYSWLHNETVLFKMPYYGDFIEKSNFEQDLNEDASTTFQTNLVKRGEDVPTRNNDAQSTVETTSNPYLQQTTPLLDSLEKPTDDDTAYPLSEDLYNTLLNDPKEDEFTYFSSSLSATSFDDDNTDIIPPIYFDIDAEASKPYAEYTKYFFATTKPHLNTSKGSLTVEGRLSAPIIDDVWKYFKYLTESTDESALPQFKGLFADMLSGSGYVTNGASLPSATARKFTHTNGARTFDGSSNPKTELAKSNDTDRTIVDILNWHPNTSPKTLVNNVVVSNYKNYTIDKYIVRPVDYEIKFFGRRAGTTFAKNGDLGANANKNGYEFSDDQSGYLEPVLDAIDVSFNLSSDPATSLESYTLATYNNSQRNAAFMALNKVISFGNQAGLANHYNFKEYKDHPKNLRVIERNLEEIRQNLMAFAEFANDTFAKQGFADKGQNRGTLYQLHRNYFIGKRTESNYSFLPNTRAALDETTTEDDKALPYTKLDKVVNYDDGIFSVRYIHDNYNQKTLNYSDPNNGVRDTTVTDRVNKLAANQIRLSEVYLAADGTWRYVGEHFRAPLLKSKY